MNQEMLLEARGKGVRAYRAHPGSWPDGIGAWYVAADWGNNPNKNGALPLIATGLARAKALDPWANVRANGEPCPPLVIETPETVPLSHSISGTDDIGTAIWDSEDAAKVAACLARGLSVREAAAELGLSKSKVGRLVAERTKTIL